MCGCGSGAGRRGGTHGAAQTRQGTGVRVQTLLGHSPLCGKCHISVCSKRERVQSITTTPQHTLHTLSPGVAVPAGKTAESLGHVVGWPAGCDNACALINYSLSNHTTTLQPTLTPTQSPHHPPRTPRDTTTSKTGAKRLLAHLVLLGLLEGAM